MAFPSLYAWLLAAFYVASMAYAGDQSVKRCINTRDGVFCPDGVQPHPATQPAKPVPYEYLTPKVKPIPLPDLLDAQRGMLRTGSSRYRYEPERGLVQGGID
jgi:hypothetical protein